ncbi:MAG: hypothetical protein ACP5QT_03815 [Brevinematia bacterium]
MIKKFSLCFFVLLNFCLLFNSLHSLEESTNKIANFYENRESLDYEKKLYIFYFDPFASPTNITSLENLKLELAEYIFPVKNLLFKKPYERLKHRYKPSLISEDILMGYSDEDFKNATQKKKTFRAEKVETEKKQLQLGYEEWETKIILSGGVSFRAGYGFIWKDPAYPSSFPGINFGLNLDQKMRVNVVGKVGERVSVSIDHSSESPENIYEIGYKALETDKGILRELRAGNVELNIPQSSYFIKYEGTSKDNYGLKNVLKFGDVENQTVLSLIKSKKGYKRFIGKRQLENIEIMDINYIKRKYVVLPDSQIDSGSLYLYISTSEAVRAEKIIDGNYFIRLVEGRDFTANYNSGEIFLSNTIDRNSSLLVSYTHHGGSVFSTNSNDVLSQDGKYIYIWRSDFKFSRFFHYSYYQLPYKNFDPSYGFFITVVYTYNKSQKADFQFSMGDFIFYSDQGLIKFKSSTPFPDLNGKIYTNASDPTSQDSVYTMQISYFREVSGYQLDFNVIEGSEKVYINGRLLSQSEYRLVPSLGEIYFNNPNIINDSDVIDIYYEYKPFWSGSQKFSIANRIDYKPNNIINLGSTIAFNILQREAGASPVGMTPDSLLMGEIDGSLNFARLFGLPDPLNIILKGEYALSYYDPNTLNYAIVEDFENIGEYFSINKNESEWILSSPTTNIDNIRYENRGWLLYKDYRIDNWDGSSTPLHYSVSLSPEKILDYSFKPGPYNTLGGHLSPAEYPNISQTSLVFDYDFRNGGEWVGAVQPVGNGPAGINLQDYNEISFWVKLQSDVNGDNTYEDTGNESVEFFIALGQFNEDSDGDGNFDYEINVTDPGYEFNNYGINNVATRVGRGRKGGGDGKIQTEDLNKDGRLDTTERLVVIPSKYVNTDVTNVIVEQGEWKKFTINLRSLTEEQKNILNNVTGLGIYIKKKNGNKGRVIVESIDFKKVSWQEKRIDNVNIETSDAFRVNMVTTLQDPYYSLKRFYTHYPANDKDQERLETFEKLHGYKSDSEANQYEEKALIIQYSLSNTTILTNTANWTGGKSGLVYKRITRAYNLSLYKNLSFYFYLLKNDKYGRKFKDLTDTYDGENLIFILGNTENSYYKWKIPLKEVSEEEWIKVNLNLSDLSMDINGVKLMPTNSGTPSLRDIYYVAIGVENENTNEAINRGALWINEIYVSEDKPSFGTAYYIEANIEYKEPLLKINEFEIVGPTGITGNYENKGLGFFSSETNKNETSYNRLSLSYNSSLIKLINYKISYQDENTATETNSLILPVYLQWNSDRKTYNHSINLTETTFVPSLGHSYTESFEKKIWRNLISMETQEYSLMNDEAKFNASSKLSLSKSIFIFTEFVKLTPQIIWEDNYALYDLSNLTNEEKKIFISNSTIYGMESFGKNLSTDTGLGIFSFKINGIYNKGIEKYNKVFDIAGYRSKFEEIENSPFLSKYPERLFSFLDGFSFTNSPLYKLDKEEYKGKLAGNTPAGLEFFKFDFYIDDSISREANAFIYDNKGNLLNRFERFLLINDNKLSLFPKFILDRITFNMRRNLDFGYQSVSNILELSNVFNTFSQIYYYHPFYYNPYILGDEARLNSLVLVSNYNVTNFQSSSRFNELYSIEFTLVNFNNIFDVILPVSYYLKSYNVTERNYQSYSQSKEGEISFTYSWKISDYFTFLKKFSNLRVGDLRLDLKVNNKENYNERKITDEYGGSLSQNIWLTLYQNFIYSFSVSFLKESYDYKISDFDQDFGLHNINTNYSLSEKWLLGGSLIYNWEIRTPTDLNIFIARLPLSEQKILNKEGVTVNSEIINYDGLKFSRFLQKIVEVIFDHETQYRFSDYITGSLLFRFLYNQYADVSATEGEIKKTYFEPGYGLQVGVDIRITF